MAARVLIIEDDAVQAEGLEFLLTSRGHSVCGRAATAERGMALAASLQPDVVIADVKLDGTGDGIEAANRIREACACVVIFLTAHADPDSTRRMLRTRPDAILVKPASARQIMRVIARALRPGGAAAAAPAPMNDR
jgi:DNA-binding NarL/FixJ family response regulator